MAYMNKEMKNELAPNVKAVLKKYGVKATLAIKHYSTIVLNIKSSKIDFDVDHNLSVNNYHIKEHFNGVARDFLLEVNDALNGVGTDNPNYNKSDIMRDYHDVGHYVDINIGKWDKPYILTK